MRQMISIGEQEKKYSMQVWCRPGRRTSTSRQCILSKMHSEQEREAFWAGERGSVSKPKMPTIGWYFNSRDELHRKLTKCVLAAKSTFLNEQFGFVCLVLVVWGECLLACLVLVVWGWEWGGRGVEQNLNRMNQMIHSQLINDEGVWRVLLFTCGGCEFEGQNHTQRWEITVNYFGFFFRYF